MADKIWLDPSETHPDYREPVPCQEVISGDAQWGRQSVADELARACAKAVDDGDMEKAKRFAAAQACVLELFPRLAK